MNLLKLLANDPIVSVINRLHYKNQNFMGICAGETGSGKSYSCIDLCFAIDGTFTADNIVFNVHDFFKLLNHHKIRKGSAIMFDELGVGASSRLWYKVENRELGFMLQAFRSMNLAVFFTTPTLSFVDRMPRKLIHAYIETSWINRGSSTTNLRWYNLENNARSDIQYNHFSICEKVKAEYVIIKKAPYWIIEDYETKKKMFNENLAKEGQEETDKKNGKDEKREKKANELARVTYLVEKEFEKTGIKPTPHQLVLDYHITETSAKNILQYIHQKYHISRSML